MAVRDLDASPRAGCEETRLRILTATRELYAAKGSRGTTTREVADRAGVNEATLFRHFGTKALLLRAMLDHFTALTNYQDTLQRVRSHATIEEQLYELARASIDNLRRKEDLIKISMAEGVTNPHGEICAWRAPMQARGYLTEFFAEKVAAGQCSGDPAWLARTFMSLFFSLVMARGLWEDASETSAEAVIPLVDLFLNGARTR